MKNPAKPRFDLAKAWRRWPSERHAGAQLYAAKGGGQFHLQVATGRHRNLQKREAARWLGVEGWELPTCLASCLDSYNAGRDKRMEEYQQEHDEFELRFWMAKESKY